MPAINLQDMAAEFHPDIQHILNESHHRWLTADETLFLFINRNLFPVSDFTVPEPALYILHTNRFMDDYDGWVNFPNGRRLQSGMIYGAVNFNFSFAQSPLLLRRTIRNRDWFTVGGNAFVHYL